MDCVSKKHLNESGYFPVVVSYYKTKWDKYEIIPHSHTRMEIMYVIEGHCAIGVQEKTITLNAFNYILLDSNVPHSLHINESCAILNIEIEFQQRNFAGTDLSDLAAQSSFLHRLADACAPFFVLKDSGSIFRTLLSLYEELDFDKPAAPGTLLLLNYLLLCLGKAVNDTAQVSHSDYDYVERACNYIKDHIEEKIKIGDISEYVHINSAYLQRLFKKINGQTIVNYINEQRILLAQKLLEQTDRDIAELALALGFSSQQYFSYLFKRCAGMSPRRYRKEHSGKAGKLNRISYAEQRVYQENLPEIQYEPGAFEREEDSQ